MLPVATGLMVQLGLSPSWSRSNSGMGWCKQQGMGWGDQRDRGVAGYRAPGSGKMVISGLMPTRRADMLCPG